MAGTQKSSGEISACHLSPAAVHELLNRHFPEAHEEIGGIEILSCGGGAAEVRLPFENRFARPGGTISGPTMFKLADLACYVAILGRLGESAVDSVTVTMTINFLARPEPGDLTCTVVMLRQGRRQVVCDARIFGAHGPGRKQGRNGRLVAQASCIYALPKEGRS